MQTGSGTTLKAHAMHLRDVGIEMEEDMICALCKCEEKDFHDCKACEQWVHKCGRTCTRCGIHENHYHDCKEHAVVRSQPAPPVETPPPTPKNPARVPPLPPPPTEDVPSQGSQCRGRPLGNMGRVRPARARTLFPRRTDRTVRRIATSPSKRHRWISSDKWRARIVQHLRRSRKC